MANSGTVAVTDLQNADLIIGTTYKGGTKGNAGDDPMSKLMGCENQGGFRPVGARNGVNTKFCVLYSDLSHDDWPDRIELETGKFYYYGDNRKVNRGIHETVKKGNLILRYSFDEYINGNRKNVPPFFVFAKGKNGRDVVFRGLAVPGAIDETKSEALKVITHNKTEGTIQNYRAIFTILDIPLIKRGWIEDLQNGKHITENSPEAWLEWLNTGKYLPLKGKRSIDHSLFNGDVFNGTNPTNDNNFTKTKGSSKNDTILIKIGHSYREGISVEELYRVTSESWKISENHLKSGDFLYYCAIYGNKIKEVYNLEGYERDLRPDRLGRFILKGSLAGESIRSQLIEVDLGNIHIGKGNPIKYYSMEELLRHSESFSMVGLNTYGTLFENENELNENEIKKLLKGLAENTKEIKTLSTNKPNWITKVDDEGIYVETIKSREKYSSGEKQEPFDRISFDFLLEAWYEFISVRKASAINFVKTKGRSSFVMALFHELSFVEKIEEDKTIFIRLKEYTTDQLPEANFEQVKTILNEVINDKLDPKLISQNFPEDSIKRLKLRARQGLKILGFVTENYIVQDELIKEYIESYIKHDYLRDRMIKHPYLFTILSLLPLLKSYNKNERLAILTEIGMLIVRNSMGLNQMEPSVSNYRTRNILNWFKAVDLVDEEWNLLKELIGPSDTDNTPPYKELIKDDQLKTLTIKEIISHIDQYIASKGFFYDKKEIQNLYLSLRTKPFVILSGISGTGKTMMVKWFAESVGATEKNGQFTLIPVRPDWSDGSDLLGYVDIAGNFKQGPLTGTIVNAINNPDRPYFVLLDEMNLARVEYYFSDILSVMESRELIERSIVTAPLLKENKLMNQDPIHFPENLYIIGTVNIDETTHPFSKKVLDRANTIEFNEVRLDYLDFLRDIPPLEPIHIHNHSFISRYIHLKDVFRIYSDIVKKGTDKLVAINDILKPLGAQVGYRVRDEICFYLAYNQEGDLMSFEHALDRCIIQKILPRISGSDSRVDGVLRNLFKYFTNRDLVEELEIYEEDIKHSNYPLSSYKTLEMLRRLRDDDFTSFWIS